MDKKFKLDDVLYTATGEYLSPENDLKVAVKDCSEHELLQHSAEFLIERNSIIQAFQNKEFSLLQYATLLTDSDKLREKLPYGVVTARTFSTEIEDDLGIMRKVTFQGTIETEKLPAPSLLEGYETHFQETLGEDELTVLTVKRHIALRQNRTDLPPSSITNKEEYENWLKTIDLKNDSERVGEFIDAMMETAQNYAGKFVTDEAEIMRIQILKELPDIQIEWEKRAIDPSRMELLSGEQIADCRLLLELQDLAKEAYEIAQRRTPKNGGSFFEQLKGLFKRNEAILLTPEDAKGI
jgi:hypothetical protein